MKRVSLPLAIIFTFVGLLLSTQAMAADKLKVAFVEFAQASGAAWVRANAEGTKYLQENVPDLEVTRVESVAENPGVVSLINDLIAKGNKIIFANGYGYGTFIPEIAKRHPDIYFVVQMATPTVRRMLRRTMASSSRCATLKACLPEK